MGKFYKNYTYYGYWLPIIIIRTKINFNEAVKEIFFDLTKACVRVLFFDGDKMVKAIKDSQVLVIS